MRVINISHEDFANFSYLNSLALKSVGVDCTAFILKKHPFGYARQAMVAPLERIRIECEKADVIQVMHTCGTMWDIVKHFRNTNKKIVVWHTGTRYRTGFEKHNERWNGLAHKQVCALTEFLTLGCENPTYISVTVEMDLIAPDYTTGEHLRFAHFPSNAIVKGTDTINRMINEVWREVKNKKFHYKFDTNKVDAQSQIQRMNECDVYIEMFALENEGKPYGSFGTTALEAAALGKIVITNHLGIETYKQYYGDCKLIIANSEQQFKFVIKGLLDWSKEQIVKRKQQTRLWAENTHSKIATGTRTLEMLKSIQG